jgi:hypothetical protein
VSISARARSACSAASNKCAYTLNVIDGSACPSCRDTSQQRDERIGDAHVEPRLNLRLVVQVTARGARVRRAQLFQRLQAIGGGDLRVIAVGDGFQDNAAVIAHHTKDAARTGLPIRASARTRLRDTWG